MSPIAPPRSPAAAISLRWLTWALILGFSGCSFGEDALSKQDSINLTPNVNSQLASLAGNNLSSISPLIQAALAATSGLGAPTTAQVSSAEAPAAAFGVGPEPPTSTQSGQTAAGHQQQPLPAGTNQQGLLASHQVSGVAAASEEPVIQLDYSSLNDEVLRKNTASFVYFNAKFEHCRNCEKFHDIWKELASDLRWWRQVVKFYSINCSDEDNIELCRRARVSQLPQVKFYWVMSSSLENDGQRLRVLGKSVHAMRHLVLDKILDSYMENARQLAAKRKELPGSAGGSPLGQLLGAAGGFGSFLQLLMGGAPGTSGRLAPVAGGGLMNGLLSGLMGNSQALGQMMSLLLELTAGKRAQRLPGNWPKLEAIEVADSQQLLASLPADGQNSKKLPSLLIMETQEFLYTGLEVLLDLSPYWNQTFVARVRDERSQLSKNLTRREDINAPALIYIEPSGAARLLMTAPKYTNDEELRRAFVRAFERRQVKYPVKRYWPSLSNTPPDRGAGNKLSDADRETMDKLHSVYMNDLTNAVRVSLMEQVFRHADLSDDQYNALTKYVYALINYFPFEGADNQSLKFLKRLHSWLQNQVGPVDINDYKKQFHDVDEVLARRDWVACRSLSGSKSVPSRTNRKASLFENPAQIGKVVSNITRLFRSAQQQAPKLKSILASLSQRFSPAASNQPLNSTTRRPSGSARGAPEDSPLDRIVKSLTSGSLGSDSSILKLISSALRGAKGGEPGAKSKFAREYPCGAWKLAHVMAVNEYVKDSPRKDVKHIVLHSLYQYMIHFYACPTCGNRVSDVSTEFRLNIDEHLQEQSDSIMLLWKVHNRINRRLEGEVRPGLPAKLQFPSESLCPKCRAAGKQAEPAGQLASPQEASSALVWHEKQVLNFLVHHYRPQSLLSSSNASSSSESPWSWPAAFSSSPAARSEPSLLLLAGLLLFALLKSL